MTGVDAGYETPLNPELVLTSDRFAAAKFLRRFQL
jgi:adenylylsulfate kinase-like enzyme